MADQTEEMFDLNSNVPPADNIADMTRVEVFSKQADLIVERAQSEIADMQSQVATLELKIADRTLLLGMLEAANKIKNGAPDGYDERRQERENAVLRGDAG